MPSLQAIQGTKSATMAITVLHADGSTTEYGVVCEYHRNPLRRLYFSLRRRLGLSISDRHVFGSGHV